MNYFLIYMLFAVTTAATSIYELLLPILQARLREGYSIENKYLICFVFFIVNILVAPVIFLSCIVPDWGFRFREVISKGLFDQE